MSADGGFSFEPLVRALLLVNHAEETVANLEALVQHERETAFDRGYLVGRRSAS